MATSLFETPRPLHEPADPSPDAADRYRALGGTTIAAVALALLSPLAVLDWWLLVVPLLAIVLGVVALRDIAARPDELTGRPLSLGAVVLAAASFAGGLAYLSWVYTAELPEGFERLSYAALQPLEGDPPTAVPDTARALDGRDVLLKGYMYQIGRAHV